MADPLVHSKHSSVITHRHGFLLFHSTGQLKVSNTTNFQILHIWIGLRSSDIILQLLLNIIIFLTFTEHFKVNFDRHRVLQKREQTIQALVSLETSQAWKLVEYLVEY